MVNSYLKNLSDLMLQKMEEGNYTIARFADECGVSCREISKIKNREDGNVNVVTLLKICKTHEISLVDVFELEPEIEERKIECLFQKFVFTDGKHKYSLNSERLRGA